MIILNAMDNTFSYNIVNVDYKWYITKTFNTEFKYITKKNLS